MANMLTSRKRLVEDDDEEMFFKRRRLHNPTDVESRLRRLLATVCDVAAPSLESNMERLAQMLEAVLEKLRVKFETSNYSHALRLIIFLANIVNSRVLSVDSFFRYLEAIMETALEDDIPQVRSDWFIYVVLRCLPYVGHELYESDKEALNNILEQIGEYIAHRNKQYVKLLQVWSGSPHEQEEYLDCLWAQISKLRDDEWKEKHIVHYYVAFDGTLAGALQHNISSFSAPPHTPESVYPLPTVVFRLFDYADCPEEGPLLPGAHSIERFLIEEDLSWIIEENIWNRKECATELLDYQKRHTVPINYMALEVIFSQLFRLPQPPTRPLFYGSLLIELCKIQPTSMPQVIAQATELLYQRIDTMHFSAVDQYVFIAVIVFCCLFYYVLKFLCYHMSNFEYRWSWSEWSDCLELDTLSAKYFFIREALQKCMCLAYHQRIENCLPESFRRIMPTKPYITYDIENEDTPVGRLAIHLNEAIRNKITNEELTEIFSDLDVWSVSEEEALSTCVAVLLNLSQKTISHSFAALTRYFKTFKQYAASEESQLIILKALYMVWKHNQQMMSVVANKMVTMTIIDASTIVAWIFSDEMKSEFERMWTWELLCGSVEHVIGHLRRCRKKLENAQRKSAGKNKSSHQNSENMDTDKIDNDDASKDEEEFDDDEQNDEDLGSLESEFEDLREYLQNLLLDVLHKFTVKLTEHIVNCDTKGEDVNTSWYKYFTARFRGFFLKHWKELFEFSETIEKELFKAHTIDAQVMESYTMFISLKS
ncbi:unnamed protein product [Anisakis simplex]|uniref:Nuclear cap-binding protein subunit 1 n=1 Tax=Anisakis simplex TaxID=6269 RepID=A0A0M3IY46_ANISI|nr:unnamed protein product [Anisakis simplex]